MPTRKKKLMGKEALNKFLDKQPQPKKISKNALKYWRSNAKG